MIVWNNSNCQVFITCLRWEKDEGADEGAEVLVNDTDYSVRPGEGIDLDIIGFSCEKNPPDVYERRRSKTL